eukprot:NODE_2880_length_2127_cov_8.739500.p1 GENE.NODE_2880_length_2127_cov_8.739500~~NODE_2880_length_2127_cov_8.739500.p1  ORF type:complete len:629 (+),score=196.11 NODE_2880_length_2127_cov_8.739500:100-1986(+)
MSALGDESNGVEAGRIRFDAFDNEEQMSGILRSLISSDGLNAAWQRTAKRLTVLEGRLKRALNSVEEFPTLYVTYEDYTSRVMTQHESKLDNHDERLAQLERDSALLLAAHATDEPKLERSVERIDTLEARCAQMEEDAAAANKRSEEGDVALEEALASARAYIEQVDTRTTQEHAGQKAALHDGLAALSDKLTKTELEIKALLVREVARYTEELLIFKPDKRTEKQERLLAALDDLLVKAVRQDVAALAEKTKGLGEDLDRQRDDANRQLRLFERKTTDMAQFTKQTRLDLMTELELRPRRAEFTEFSDSMLASVNSLSHAVKSFQSQTLSKMSEVGEHFTNLHDTINDHEHCLAHHAEEIENRGTKYDLLMVQGQIDKSTTKDELDREIRELKNLLSWQSGKIETFALGSSMPRPKAKRLRTPRKSTKSNASSTVGGSGTDPDSNNGLGTEPAGDAEHSTARSLDAFAPDCAEGDEEDESSSSAPEVEVANDVVETANLSLLRTQVEGLAMGVVGLAHLLFRDSRLGQSRNARLTEERDLLTQLQDLRHWITHKAWPAGWDPTKITTCALKCSHPRADQPVQPLPQLSLKKIVRPKRQDMSGSMLEISSTRVPSLPPLVPSISVSS